MVINYDHVHIELNIHICAPFLPARLPLRCRTCCTAAILSPTAPSPAEHLSK